MRLTIDASTLAYPKRTGIGRYLESVLPELTALLGPEASITLLAGRPLVNPTALDLVRTGRVAARTVDLPSLYAWQQTGMAWQLALLRPDVHLAPDGLLPLGYAGRSVCVVHDALWKRFPEALAWHIRAVFGLRQKRSLYKATTALSVSDFTRRELLRVFGPVGTKARVVRTNAVNREVFRPARPDDAATARFLERHGLAPGYVLCLGNLMAHKNLGVAVRAMRRLWSRGDPRTLVVVGHGDPAGLGLGPADRTRCLGYLPEAELPAAYRAASAFVFPSKYEGFGLPVLEAMASGVPVVHADAGALPETAGGAGLAFPPDDDPALAAILDRLSADPVLADYHRRRGLDRAGDFSWAGAAADLAEALMSAAGRRPEMALGATRPAEKQHRLPTVSIVTPSFNQAPYLRQNLESVKNQRGVTVEHIVLDGGSTDGSVEIIKEYDAHLAYWRSAPDRGQTAALIEGFDRATGDILGWLNSDDHLWDDEALSRVAAAFAAHPLAAMVAGDTVLVTADGRPCMIDMPFAPSGRLFRGVMATPQQSAFFRRSAYLEVGGIDPDFGYCMDFDLFQRLSQGREIVRVPAVLAAFRQHPTTKTATWGGVFRREMARCQGRFGRGPLHWLFVKAVTMEVRLGSILAQIEAFLGGRKLPTWSNARLEPARALARRRHDLAG